VENRRSDHDDHDDHDEHDDHDDHLNKEGHAEHDDEEDSQAKTLTIRIVAVFATAATTFLGLAVFFTKQSKAISTETLLCLRAASAGAMVSVAIVHILPEAGYALESVTPYPLAGTLVLGMCVSRITCVYECTGVLCCNCMEGCANVLIFLCAVGAMLAYFHDIFTHDHGHPVDQRAQAPSVVTQSNEQVRAPTMMTQLQPAQYMQGQYMQGAPLMIPVQAPLVVGSYGTPVVGSAFGAGEPLATDVESGKMSITASKGTVQSLEFGCVAHSIVLGMALGLQTNLHTATILLIVFIFHQLLESMCLSHLIASLESRTEAFIMVVMTTWSMPLGIIIGLIISYSANSTKNAKSLAPVTSGIACIAGGMLLYSALINIIADDMHRPEVKASAWLKRVMCISLVLGGSAMSALAAGEVAGGGHVHR